MKNTEEISNNSDILDSRDIIARIEYLETELTDAQEGIGEEQSAMDADEWLKQTSEDDAHTMQDAAREYQALRALAEEASCSPDWTYGETLIRDSYFEDYARELAEDIGAVPKEQAWPACHIDWEAAANALKQDYISVSFDGVDYWIRA